jgi:hypothetical protein
MDLGHRTPLIDLFLRGEVPREVRLLAAQGAVAPRAHEQLALLAFLHDDADAEVRDAARQTIGELPGEALAAFLARPDVPPRMRDFFAPRAGPAPASPAADDDPLLERPAEVLPAEEVEVEPSAGADAARAAGRHPLSELPVIERVKLAMRGSREQRAVLVRDPSRLVTAAVLSSSRLADAEVEAFARMSSVSEDVLRTIATTRRWARNYSVVAALARNPKTPTAVSMPMVSRLNERDLKMAAAMQQAYLSGQAGTKTGTITVLKKKMGVSTVS